IKQMSIIYVAFLLGGCSSFHRDAETNVAAELSAQPPIAKAELQKTKTEIIQTAPALSLTEKGKIEALTSAYRHKNAALREEMVKREIVLLKKLVEPGSSDHEIAILKNDILSLEKDRVDLWLKTYHRT